MSPISIKRSGSGAAIPRYESGRVGDLPCLYNSALAGQDAPRIDEQSLYSECRSRGLTLYIGSLDPALGALPENQLAIHARPFAAPYDGTLSLPLADYCAALDLADAERQALYAALKAALLPSLLEQSQGPIQTAVVAAICHGSIATRIVLHRAAYPYALRRFIGNALSLHLVKRWRTILISSPWTETSALTIDSNLTPCADNRLFAAIEPESGNGTAYRLTEAYADLAIGATVPPSEVDSLIETYAAPAFPVPTGEAGPFAYFPGRYASEDALNRARIPVLAHGQAGQYAVKLFAPSGTPMLSARTIAPEELNATLSAQRAAFAAWSTLQSAERLAALTPTPETGPIRAGKYYCEGKLVAVVLTPAPYYGHRNGSVDSPATSEGLVIPIEDRALAELMDYASIPLSLSPYSTLAQRKLRLHLKEAALPPSWPTGEPASVSYLISITISTGSTPTTTAAHPYAIVSIPEHLSAYAYAGNIGSADNPVQASLTPEIDPASGGKILRIPLDQGALETYQQDTLTYYATLQRKTLTLAATLTGPDAMSAASHALSPLDELTWDQWVPYTPVPY